jgi:hypothetical protein
VIIAHDKVNYRWIFKSTKLPQNITDLWELVRCSLYLYDFLLICVLSLLKSVKIRTSPVFLACMNVVAARSESELQLKTSIYDNLFISVFTVEHRMVLHGNALQHQLIIDI